MDIESAIKLPSPPRQFLHIEGNLRIQVTAPFILYYYYYYYYYFEVRDLPARDERKTRDARESSRVRSAQPLGATSTLL